MNCASSVAALALVAALPAAALAGDAPGPKTGWTGLTVGAIGAFATGHNDWSGDTYDLKATPFAGGFLTYNHQIGNVVLGADVKAQFGKQLEVDYPTFFYTAFYDLNGRIGFAHGDALIYASGGVTIAGISEDGVAFQRTGHNLGVGIDYRVADHVVVGAEYTYRSLEAICEPHDEPFELNGHAVQLRLGFQL